MLSTLLRDVGEALTAEAEQWPHTGDLARHLEPRTVSTPALELIDEWLLDAAEGRRRRIIISMPPQEGKSQRISRFFPTWMLHRNKDLRIASVSASDMLARRWGRQVRNDIKAHPELGIRVRQDTQAANEWVLDGYDGGMITTSIGGSLTGRPVDVMIIDDPVKDQKDADSEIMRARAIEWWQTVASTRLPENGIVIVVMTRWHEGDLAGWLLSEENEDSEAWELLNIPAQAEHDPGRGVECKCAGRVPTGKPTCIGYDVLGRKPGEYMVSARGRTHAGWEQRKRSAGSRGWNALFQGRPAPLEGAILKRHWWRYYDRPRWTVLEDGSYHAIGTHLVLISVDCAFKDTDGSDYVVLAVWAQRGPKVWLLDLVRRKMDFEATLQAVRDMAAKWPQASIKLIEDKANGTAVINTLQREIGGILPYSPPDSKQARAYAVSPFVEAGDVSLPAAALCPWVVGFVDECADFPNGANDDQVDVTTQALIRMLLLGTGGAGFMSDLMRGEDVARQAADDAESVSGTQWRSTPDDIPQQREPEPDEDDEDMDEGPDPAEFMADLLGGA